MNDTAKINKIVAQCKKGSEKAFRELLGLYANRCYGYFYRLCGNQAKSEDLLSELFVRLVTKIGSFKGGSFENWLFTIARNLFTDDLRRQYRNQKMLEDKAEEIEQDDRPAVGSNDEIFDRLQVHLGRLDPETAELITLRFYSEMSFKELAEMRKEPIGTTLSKVHRGLKKLREFMEADSA